jgi:hypothetical protein
MDFNLLKRQLGFQTFTILTCLSGVVLAVALRRRYPGVWIRVMLALLFELTIEFGSSLWYSLYSFIVVKQELLTDKQFEWSAVGFNLAYALTFCLLIWAAFSGRRRLG